MPQRPNNSNPFLATPAAKAPKAEAAREPWMPPLENAANVEAKIVGGKLVLTIDPQYAVNVSRSGKTDVIASTYVVGGLRIGIANVSLTVSVPRGTVIPADYVAPAKADDTAE